MITERQREVLLKTKQRLLNDGWQQFGWGEKGVRTGKGSCLVQYINMSSGRSPGYKNIFRVLLEALDIPFYGERKDPVWNLIMWNDEEGRTLEQVIDLIDRVLMDNECTVVEQQRKNAVLC